MYFGFCLNQSLTCSKTGISDVGPSSQTVLFYFCHFNYPYVHMTPGPHRSAWPWIPFGQRRAQNADATRRVTAGRGRGALASTRRPRLLHLDGFASPFNSHSPTRPHSLALSLAYPLTRSGGG